MMATYDKPETISVKGKTLADRIAELEKRLSSLSDDHGDLYDKVSKLENVMIEDVGGTRYSD